MVFYRVNASIKINGEEEYNLSQKEQQMLSYELSVKSESFFQIEITKRRFDEHCIP